MTKLFLFDIEGTTTDINFVHKILFPYAAEKMESFIQSHQTNAAVLRVIESVKSTVREEENKLLGLQDVIAKLNDWIKEDRKHPALKEVQGLIWDSGYINNHFKGHIYPDVEPFFRKIIQSGSKIGIYSSGSVHAQKLIFGYSEAGDLNPLISYYFDTKVGPKREKSSYENIAKEVNLSPAEIQFFSDIAEELVAAKAAGISGTQVMRQGKEASEFECITNFRSFMDKI